LVWLYSLGSGIPEKILIGIILFIEIIYIVGVLYLLYSTKRYREKHKKTKKYQT